MNITTKKLDNAEVEITGSLEAATFDAYRPRAVKNISESVSLKGFRPGHVPEKMLVENVGELTILEEMASLALQEIFPKIIEENKIEAIGRPEISITKMAQGNPLEFVIKTAVMPTFILPGYRALVSKINAEPIVPPTVTDEEVEKVIEEIKKNRGDNMAGLPEGDALKDKVRENMTLEKTEQERQKRRVAILDAIIASCDVVIPRVLIERESHAMAHEFRNNVEMMGITFADYLVKIKKTEEDIIKDSEGPAVNRIKAKMILKKIAEAEKVTVPETDLKNETDKILEYYKDADRDAAKQYAEEIMSNEMVFKLLESLVISH